MFFGLQVGVIPPAAAARGVANRHETEHLILMNRAARHLDVVGAFGDVGAPVFFTLLLNPLVEQWVDVLSLVVTLGQPDIVIQPRRFPGEILHVVDLQAQHTGHFIDAIVTMTEAANFDVSFARHQGAAFIDRVARLDQPGVGTGLFHFVGDIQHQLEILVRTKVDAAIVIAILGRQIPNIPLVIVADGRRRVDDKIGIGQCCAQVECVGELQVRAKFAAVALGQLGDHVETTGVNVHKMNHTAGQVGGQTKVFD